jgi:hypothetical protein
MKHFWLSVLSCLILTALPVFGAETFEENLVQGKLAFRSGDYKTAISFLQAAVEQKPESVEANVDLAISLNRTGNLEAINALFKALALDPGNISINYELALYYYDHGNFHEAEDFFENVAILSPASPQAAVSSEYLEKIKSRTKRDWSLKFMAGMQYDSNVATLPTDKTIEADPVKTPHRSDWRAVLSGGADYGLFQSAPVDITAGYSIYANLHHMLDSFNVVQNALSLNTLYKIDKQHSARLNCNVETVHLGGIAYSFATTISPSYSFFSETGFGATLDYRYRNNKNWNSSDSPDNDDRSSDTHALGVTGFLPLGKRAQARAGYGYEQETTKVSRWDARSNKANVGFMYSFPTATTLDLGGEYTLKKYDNFIPDIRKDETYSGSVSLTQNFGTLYSIVLNNTYIRAFSNVKQYDYERNISSLMFNARF